MLRRFEVQQFVPRSFAWQSPQDFFPRSNLKLQPATAPKQNVVGHRRSVGTFIEADTEVLTLRAACFARRRKHFQAASAFRAAMPNPRPGRARAMRAAAVRIPAQ